MKKELKQNWEEFAETGDCQKVDCEFCPFTNKVDDFGICHTYEDERIKGLNEVAD